MRIAVAFVFLVLSSTSQAFQQDPAHQLSTLPDSNVTSLTSSPGPFTEPSVAIDPSSPDHVVAVFQDNVHASFSADGGRTWAASEGVAPPNYKVSGDVSTTFDKHGNAFVCYIAFDRLGTTNYWAHRATRNGIFVRRSMDGGKTWEHDHIPVVEQPTSPGIPFEDKPIIVADNNRNSKFSGNLYVGWTRWRMADSQIVISRSTDDGKTWSQPAEIDLHPGLPRDDNGAAEGFDAAVAADGTVYVVWSQDNEIWLASSRNGGQSFSKARPVIKTAPIMYAISTLERANGFPQIGVDPKSGKLFICWSDYRNGDLDVFLSSSSDHGKKWSQAARVNTDTIHNGAEQFFQWMAVDPSDGSVNVVFYDRRNDPRELSQQVVLARSTDGGQSFKNFLWTKKAFTVRPDIFFGDYNGLAAFGGKVVGVWTEFPASETSQSSEKKPEDKQPEVQAAGAEPEKPVSADKSAKKAEAKGTIVEVGTANFKTN